MANRKSSKSKGEFVERVAGIPLRDDKEGKYIGVGSLVNLEPNRAKYLEAMGQAYKPGEQPEKFPDLPDPDRPKKGLEVIDVEDEEDEKS